MLTVTEVTWAFVNLVLVGIVTVVVVNGGIGVGCAVAEVRLLRCGFGVRWPSTASFPGRKLAAGEGYRSRYRHRRQCEAHGSVWAVFSGPASFLLHHFRSNRPCRRRGLLLGRNSWDDSELGRWIWAFRSRSEPVTLRSLFAAADGDRDSAGR